MTNLTTTAYWTRKGIRYGIFALIAFLILRVVWGITTSYLRKVRPPAPPPPTISFGRIPALKFPQKENLPQIAYQLETIEGTIPKLPTVGKVYFMPRPVANLLALQRAKELARKMGFLNEPAKISDRIYRFEGQNPLSALEMDIISQKFKLTYDFANDQQILIEKKLPGDEQAVAEAKSFLRQAGLLSLDLENGGEKVSYLRYNAPELAPAISLSEADFVRVDLFRKNLDDLKVLPPNPNQSSVSSIFSGARETGKRIIKVDYAHQPVSEENYATYPFKSSATAWQELANGQGFVASLGENSQDKVTIRKVYLAYFDSDEIQDFLQPIFVFEGDKGFVGYIQAVDPKWIE